MEHHEDAAVATNRQIVLAAADRLGIKAEKLANGVVELRYKGQSSYFQGADFEFENLMASKICGDKLLTSTILLENGFPVPEFATFSFREYTSAVDFFNRLQKPVVVKPQSSTAHSRGVTTNIYTIRDFERAFALAAVLRRRIMVERFVEGQTYRFLLLDGELLSVVKRNPPHVVGDGVRTVQELIDENEANSPNGWDRRLDIDYQQFMRINQVDLQYMPRCDEVVYMKNACVYQGWPNQIVEVTNESHPDFIRCVKEINKVIRAKLCAIDVFATDITKPLSEVDFVVNEVNTTPALQAAYEPIAPNQFPDKVGVEILKHIFSIQ
jgi:cyanophycin synthetase